MTSAEIGVSDRISNNWLHLGERTQEIFEKVLISDRQELGLAEAWDVIWTPMTAFQLASPGDRGAVAAAILTAAIRSWLPTAPGFAVLGTTPASGKTTLALCIGELAGIDRIAIIPGGMRDEAVWGRIITALLDGSTILLDNFYGRLTSPAIATLLTHESFTLTALQRKTPPVMAYTNVMTLMTGSAILDEDLQQRFITAELAPEKLLAKRRLGATPRKFYREHRREISEAALALLGRYIAAGAERISSDQPGPEFQSWDELVRQCVLWLARCGVAELGDPIANSFPR